MDLRELDLRLTPAHFFDLEIPVFFLTSKKDLFKKKYKLNVDTLFSFEDPLGACFMAWGHQKLVIGLELEDVFDKRDALQLFFDTNNGKATKNRFCHVFSVQF
ncbi:MAG: hypothetical protein K940chlam8_01221 [Chlamydiae bacterium]|nr:hypothetical protein [Chlamydiota bacterium]